MDPISDQLIIDAIKKRLLREVESGSFGGVVNNVYGNSMGAAAPSAGAATSGSPADIVSGMDPGDFDYYVDISRQDLEPGDVDPLTGQPVTRKGWAKSVHRHRKPKGSGGGRGPDDDDDRKKKSR